MSTLTQLFTSIANAIRAKNGTSALIQAEDFPTEIAGIPVGKLTNEEYEEALDLSEQILATDSLYTPVEYAESTGTQYINLDIIGSSSIDFKIKLATTEENPTTIRRILGGYNSSNRYELALHNSSDGIFLNYYSGSYYTYYSPTVNVPFELEKNGTKLTSPIGITQLPTNTFSSGKASYLFASNRTSTYRFIGRIYYCKIYDNNQIVRSLIPCIRTSDEEVGLYDQVTSQFFTNAGTGSFIAGPVVQ